MSVKKSGLVSKAGFTHEGQSQGHGIGTGMSKSNRRTGGVAKGTGSAGGGAMGNIPSPAGKGSSLVGKAGFTHEGQSQGHSIGTAGKGGPNYRGSGSNQVFPVRCNPLTYGRNGGHRIGSRSK